MSLESHRQLIAAAAATADGVNAHEHYSADTTPGTCYPRLARIAHDNNPWDGVVFWNVVVVLPQDYADAEAWVADRMPPLRDALREQLHVTEVVPQRLDTGAGIVPALFINGWREED